MSKKLFYYGSTASFVNEYSLDFDGVNESCISADSALLSFTNGAGVDLPFSTSVWVKADSHAVTFSFLCKGTTVSREWYFVMSTASRLTAACSSPSGAAEIVARSSSTYAGDIGAWHHYVFTYSGSETYGGMTIYRDGVAIATTNASAGAYTGMTNGTGGAYMGQFFNSANYADGKIDEVSLWSIELSAAQVTAIYNGGNPTDLTGSADLVEWWRNGDGSTYPNIFGVVNGILFGMTNMEAGDIQTDVP